MSSVILNRSAVVLYHCLNQIETRFMTPITWPYTKKENNRGQEYIWPRISGSECGAIKSTNNLELLKANRLMNRRYVSLTAPPLYMMHFVKDPVSEVVKERNRSLQVAVPPSLLLLLLLPRFRHVSVTFQISRKIMCFHFVRVRKFARCLCTIHSSHLKWMSMALPTILIAGNLFKPVILSSNRRCCWTDLIKFVDLSAFIYRSWKSDKYKI